MRNAAKPIVILLCGVGTVVGMSCGGTSPKPDPSRLARLVASTNSLCRRGSPVRQGQIDIVERAAEYLPAGEAFKKAHAERRALEPKLLRAFNEVASGDASQRSTTGLVDRFYRLQMRIYDSLKALGLGPCLGSPPHRMIVG